MSRPPRIVVLDGYTLNPGDLSWEPLQALGTCEVHDRTPPAEASARARDAEILLTNKTPVSAETLGHASHLRYIGVLATGYNIVDVETARQRGIPVTNVPGYATDSVAQLVFGHLLNLTLRVGDHSRAVREGRWSACPDFSFWDHPLIELAGQTLGIIGFGRTGRAVARLARAFHMRVLAHTRTPPALSAVTFVDLETLLGESDVLTLHCPLVPETRHLINARRLACMKPTAFLINLGRGALIDEKALADALRRGRLAGAGLDVLSSEPPPADHPLYAAPNCFITPHLAWATHASRARLLAAAIANVKAFLEGRLQQVVNGVGT